MTRRDWFRSALAAIVGSTVTTMRISTVSGLLDQQEVERLVAEGIRLSSAPMWTAQTSENASAYYFHGSGAWKVTPGEGVSLIQ